MATLEFKYISFYRESKVLILDTGALLAEQQSKVDLLQRKGRESFRTVHAVDLYVLVFGSGATIPKSAWLVTEDYEDAKQRADRRTESTFILTLEPPEILYLNNSAKAIATQGPEFTPTLAEVK